MQGYIKLHRQLLEWEWYKNTPVKTLFIHCLLRANHADKKWQGVLIKKGSFITSYENLSIETGLSYKQVRTALDKLKLTGEVAHQTTSQYSIITINNWDKFQIEGIQEGSQRANEGQAEGSQRATNNNDKNVKNEKNIYLAHEKKLDPFTHPIIEKYMKVYKEIMGKRVYLDSKHRYKLVELYNDIPDFEGTIETVLKRLKYIKFDGIDFIPNSSWLLKDDNYIKVLEGSFGTKEQAEEYLYNAYN